MYLGISVSPDHGSFALGVAPKPSELENLIAGRKNEVGNLMNQSEFQRLLGGNKDVGRPTAGVNFFGNGGALSQNAFGSLLVAKR